MRWLRRVVSVLGLVTAGLFLAPVAPACACSCAPFRIFGGSSADPVTVEFEVSEVHKGDVPARMTLTTAMDGASCGYAFREGGRYLVFAADYGSGLSTGLCSGNLDLAVERDPFGAGTAPRPAPPSAPSPGPIVALTPRITALSRNLSLPAGGVGTFSLKVLSPRGQ